MLFFLNSHLLVDRTFIENIWGGKISFIVCGGVILFPELHTVNPRANLNECTSSLLSIGISLTLCCCR